MSSNRPRLQRTSLAAAILFLAFACARAADAPPRPPGPSGPPTMQADGRFFNGAIEVTVRLGAGPGRRPDSDEKAAGDVPPQAGRPRGRRGPPGGGPPGGGGGFGGPPPGDEGPAVARSAVRPRPGGTGRPLMIHFTLVNRGDQSATVEVADFNSALGNFVVLPSRFQLAPGATAEAEPMTSRLGNAAAEVPMTVRLRLAGKSEQQVLTLRVIAAPPPVAPAAEAAAAAPAAQQPRS